MDIKEIMINYDIHKEDPNYLSNLGVYMTSQLFTHNTLTAEAELKEKESLVNLLSVLDPITNKRMSVAEAENRAVVNTKNDYGKLKKQAEAWIELLYMIKTRIKVLMNERENV